MITTRQYAENLRFTNPYPDSMNGLTKVREEVWINGLNGLASEEDSLHQMNKNLADYKHDIKGFYCSGGIHIGVFKETDPTPHPYRPDKIWFKYYIHYAVYR